MRVAFLVAVVLALDVALVALAGCSAKRQVAPDLTAGHLGKAVWKDCRVNPKLAIVTCDCTKFDILTQSNGTAVLACPHK